MTEKQNYLTPETEEILLRPEGNLLTESVTTEESFGENATLDGILNPW